MNKIERIIISIFFLYLSAVGYVIAEKWAVKNDLEIQKLKYELSVYKEMEESGK